MSLVFLYQFEMDILEWFYRIGNQFLDYLFWFISQLGGSTIVCLLVCLFYWIINKEKAEKIALTIFSSICLNTVIKSFCNFKRPFNYEGHEHLQKLKNTSLSDSSVGSSFPSGHSQITGCLYTTISLQYPKKIIIIPSIILMILVPISRLYLGVHFPSDVIIGLVLGIIVAFVYYVLFTKFPSKLNLIYIITLIVYFPFLFFKNAEYEFFRSYGLLIGFFGGKLLENKFINFTNDVGIVKKILRFLVGGLCIGIVYFLTKLVPSEISHISYVAVLLHIPLTLTATVIVPIFFKNKFNKNGI